MYYCRVVREDMALRALVKERRLLHLKSHLHWQKIWALMGIKTIEVNLQGPGAGRDSVVRSMQASGINVSVLRDVTPLPHNGCRAPKKRRV